MPRFNLNYTFRHHDDDGDLACCDCPFQYNDRYDGMSCCVTGTSEYDQAGFDKYKGRLKDCPLKEVKE